MMQKILAGAACVKLQMALDKLMQNQFTTNLIQLFKWLQFLCSNAKLGPRYFALIEATRPLWLAVSKVYALDILWSGPETCQEPERLNLNERFN